MAIELPAWEGYRVVWLRVKTGQGQENTDQSWKPKVEAYSHANDSYLAEVMLQLEDNEPRHFVETFERVVGPVLDLPAQAAHARNSPEYRSDWVALINKIIEFDRPLLLVIEGIDQINHQGVHELLAELLEYQPSNLQILLICQKMPPLPLPRLRARRGLLEITM